MKDKELTEKIALLKDGQIVMIDGLPFSAKRVDGFAPCITCNVDSLCHGNVFDVCCQLDVDSKSIWYLNLESER